MPRNRLTRQQADEAYAHELRQEAKLLRDNIDWFKHCFDVEHMQDLSRAAKLQKLPMWRVLNRDIAPLVRRLCVIEWQLEDGKRPIPLHS